MGSESRGETDNPIERITDTFRSMVETGLFPLACDYNFCRELAYIIGRGECSCIVETGTFKAETTRFLAAAFPDLDVFSCDVKQEFVEAARALFRGHSSVTVQQASSPDFIKALVDAGKTGDNPFFFLDAHWYDYLPLNDELRLILASGRGIACIHDFKVPGTPEYGFDVYGSVTIGMELILPTLDKAGIPYRVYFPKPPSPSLTKPFRNGTRIWNFAQGEIEKLELRGRCYILAGQPNHVVRVFDELVEFGLLVAGGSAAPRAAKGSGTLSSATGSPGKRVTASRPSIDLVVLDDPIFSWNQREGWISAMSALGVLNQVHRLNAGVDSTSEFFQTIRRSSADFLLMLCCDHHLSFLHDSPEKKEFWKNYPRPVVCHSIERVIGSPFPGSETKSRSAAQTFDAFIYIDEFAAGIFESSGKPSMWIPQYVDDEVFRSTIPFEQREPKVFFRGKIFDYGIAGVYQDRQRLLANLQDDPSFVLSEAHRPNLTIQQAAALKEQYRFVLNAPANCPGYSASLYEALASGCAVFQYALPAKEVLSRNLFVPGRHFMEYDPGDPDGLKAVARYACSHWNDFKKMADLGREECLARHTIKKRVEEIIAFVGRNWDAMGKSAPALAGTAAIGEVHAFEEVAAKVAAVEGFLVKGQDEYLFNKVKSLPDDAVIVEIGSYLGLSTVAMGFACINSNRKIYCIDTWDGNDSDFLHRDFFAVWEENVRKHNLQDYVVPLRGLSHVVLKQWQEKRKEGSIDFIFIDGSHRYHDVLADFLMAYPLVKPGGFIALHDVVDTWPGPYQVWHDTVKHLLQDIEYASTLACGKRTRRKLPAHLTTQPQSALDQIIPPEIKNDEFYFLIERLCRQEEIKTVLEIGSSSGGGSTEAFISGISQNPRRPHLYCMEISSTRFKALQQSYAHLPFVHCYNVSSVPATEFPSEREVELFYRWIPSGLNNYPLEQVLGWLRQDMAYVKGAGVPENGIQRVKQEEDIAHFDMVLIDGSEFLGTAELDEVYGARYILLDDVKAFKNYGNYKRLSEDPEYHLVHENLNLRSGFAVFARN